MVANKLVKRTAALAMEIFKVGGYFSLENPWDSLIWDLQEATCRCSRTSTPVGSHVHVPLEGRVYDSCSGTQTRYTTLATECPEERYTHVTMKFGEVMVQDFIGVNTAPGGHWRCCPVSGLLGIVRIGSENALQCWPWTYQGSGREEGCQETLLRHAGARHMGEICSAQPSYPTWARAEDHVHGHGLPRRVVHVCHSLFLRVGVGTQVHRISRMNVSARDSKFLRVPARALSWAMDMCCSRLQQGKKAGEVLRPF